jgi:hypothetical protein
MRRSVLRGYVIFFSLENEGAGVEARLSLYLYKTFLNYKPSA